MRGFARQKEVLAIYSGKTPFVRKDGRAGARSVKGRNKISHSKSISANVGNSPDKSFTPSGGEYDYSSFNPKYNEEIKGKR